MRVVFMGSPGFAVPSLRALASAHDVVAVYTPPDRVRGRGKRLVPTPVKETAEELGLAIRQPLTLRDPSETEALAGLRPDVVCVAAFGMLLPPDILAVPEEGCINVHASILPRHRGAAPIHRAILEGDEETGVSIMRMEEGLDTGAYARIVKVPVDDADVCTLTARLADIGAEALMDVLTEIEAGTAVWIPQDETHATYAGKITDTDLVLDPGLDVQTALRRIRASDDSARAKLRISGRVVDVVRAEADTAVVAQGTARRAPDALLLGFSDGAVAAAEVRPEGRPVMNGSSFACGLRADTDVWTRP